MRLGVSTHSLYACIKRLLKPPTVAEDAAEIRWLKRDLAHVAAEAQEQATNWLWTYNNDQPCMGIGGITPAMKLQMAA